MSSEIEDWIEENFPKATAENLRRRLAEAERLLERFMHIYLHDGHMAEISMDVFDFLNQKGGDVTDYSGIVEQQKQRIAELERLYKAAMKSAEDRLQAASAAEVNYSLLWERVASCGGIGNSEAKPIEYALDKVEQWKRDIAQYKEIAEKERNQRVDSGKFHSQQYAEKCLEFATLHSRMEIAEEELATLKSVRVMSGNDLRAEWHNITEVDECDHWDRFAERLQLRSTCPPMSAEELLEIYADPNYSAQQSMERIAGHIWPKVAPKPTREEVAGRIVVAFKNDVLTVFTLDGLTAETRRIEYYADRKWQSVIVAGLPSDCWSDSRDEAEQAAREMLVDAVIGLG